MTRCIGILVIQLLAGQAAAVQIVPIFQERTTAASAAVGSPEGSESNAADEAAADFEPFVSDLQASVDGRGASGQAESSQDSRIGPRTIVAQGSTRVSGVATAPGSDGSFLSESSLEILFESQGGFFELTGSLRSETPLGAGMGLILVEAVLPSRDVELAIHQIGPGDSVDFFEIIQFGSTARFRITARALSSADVAGPSASEGSASFTFQLVPEPVLAPLAFVAALMLGTAGPGRH